MWVTRSDLYKVETKKRCVHRESVTVTDIVSVNFIRGHPLFVVNIVEKISILDCGLTT